MEKTTHTAIIFDNKDLCLDISKALDCDYHKMIQMKLKTLKL